MGNDLKSWYKPLDEASVDKLPHDFTEYQEFPHLTKPLMRELDDFGDKILTLFPLILEAKSMVLDMQEYKDRVDAFIKQQRKKKNIYYLGIRKYKKLKHYNDDEIGPICGVFDNIKDFNQWKKDKNIQKEYGRDIKKVRYVQTDHNKKKVVDQNVNDAENANDENNDNRLKKKYAINRINLQSMEISDQSRSEDEDGEMKENANNESQNNPNVRKLAANKTTRSRRREIAQKKKKKRKKEKKDDNEWTEDSENDEPIIT